MSEVSATRISTPAVVHPTPAAATSSPPATTNVAANAKPQPPSEAAKAAPFRVDPQQMRQVLQDIASELNRQVQRTGTALGLMMAYLVRFSAVALQTLESGYARVPPSIDGCHLRCSPARSRASWASRWRRCA